ncbi:unnamed protein product, partial [Ceratitis capitata]
PKKAKRFVKEKLMSQLALLLSYGANQMPNGGEPTSRLRRPPSAIEVAIKLLKTHRPRSQKQLAR